MKENYKITLEDAIYLSTYHTFEKVCEQYLKVLEKAQRGLIEFPQIIDKWGIKSWLCIIYDAHELDLNRITKVLELNEIKHTVVNDTLCVQCFTEEQENFVLGIALPDDVDDKNEEPQFDFSVEGLMRIIVGNDIHLTELKSDLNTHSMLIDLTMKAYTYIFNPLPFDEVGKRVQHGHWNECLEYAKKHNLAKPSLTLSPQIIAFFKQIF